MIPGLSYNNLSLTEEVMNTIDHMKNLIDLFKNTSDTTGKDYYAQVKAYMSEMADEKNKHNIVECLSFITSVASNYTCHHGQTTIAKHPLNSDQIETCNKCGQSRAIWTTTRDEGYGEISTDTNKSAWEYPKK